MRTALRSLSAPRRLCRGVDQALNQATRPFSAALTASRGYGCHPRPQRGNTGGHGGNNGEDGMGAAHKDGSHQLHLGFLLDHQFLPITLQRHSGLSLIVVLHFFTKLFPLRFVQWIGKLELVSSPQASTTVRTCSGSPVSRSKPA